MSENSWFRQNQIFFNYAALGISAAYLAYMWTLELPTWLMWIIYIFNPLTVYGIVLMYLRREALYRAYDMFSALWSVRKYEKEHGIIELEEQDYEED